LVVVQDGGVQVLSLASRSAPSGLGAESGGRITQELAGAPELLRRYQQATPAARAVLWAAMDARRLGHSLFLPEPLLQEAAPGYLDDHDWDQIGGDWFRGAMDELTAPYRRLSGPLVERRPCPGEPHPPHRLRRLADYLEQHARTGRSLICPPASFWIAAVDHALTLDDLIGLGEEAKERGRYRHAAQLHQQGAERLYQQATDARDTRALTDLARLAEAVGEQPGAERLYRQAADAGDTSH
jgi:hypothetical protein